ncbi:hypothetical protein ACIGW8_37820 [Streptomyces sioyaensis]|uniref:hypothetical protein n=1 Tax=Streptomyces sioyaensis TaxID=67364 RepID=UPI0037CE8B71
MPGGYQGPTAIGNHFLASDHGTRPRGAVVSHAADLLLNRPHPPCQEVISGG